MQWRHTAAPPIRDYVAGIVSAPGLISNEFRPIPGGPFGLWSAVTLEPRAFDMRDCPIGMERLVSAPDRFSFQPRVLVLTYEGARAAVTRDAGFGPGVIEVRYDEAPELEGSYPLFFKVERVGWGQRAAGGVIVSGGAEEFGAPTRLGRVLSCATLLLPCVGA